MRKAILIAAVSLLGTTTVGYAAGEIYRWKDANGIWHYADQPQPGAELVSGRRPPAPPPPASAPANAAQESATAPLPPVSNEVARAVREEAAAVRADQCSKAEEAYQKAIQARRMFRTDEQGNRTYLNDAELDAARLQARSARDLACGS